MSGNDAAFPRQEQYDERRGEVEVCAEAGLTKREWYAGLAMQGLLAGCAGKVHAPYTLAPDAVDCADALIAALEKQESQHG